MDWAQNWLLVLAGLGLTLLAVRWREGVRPALRPFIPAALWLAFAGIAMVNPSHAPTAGGGWEQRETWIRWLPSTVDIPHTIADVRLWLPCLLQTGLLVTLLRSTRATRLIWGVIAFNGFALAAIGAGFHFSGAERLLGVMDGPEPTYFFATFFYKNHWAAYGALGAIAAFALALHVWPAAIAGDPRARGQALLFGGAGLLTAITLPLPGSRAGALLALSLIIAFVSALFARSRRHTVAVTGGRRHWPFAIGLLAIAGIAFFGVQSYSPRATVDLDRTREQLGRNFDREPLDLRLLLSRDTWRMTRQRPWFGWGPGCFEIVFPIFQGTYLRGPGGRPNARFEAAHNDWLQLAAESGVTGAAILLVPAALLAWRGWRRTRASGRFGLAGCGLIAAYAWIDFPFHNPAVLLLWAVMLASAARLAPASPES